MIFKQLENAVSIYLDGSLKSALLWKEALDEAKSFVDQGKKILFDLDLGLLEGLQFPIGNQQQFQSLKLSIEHFVESIWSQFHTHSLGVCLYRGSIDFTEHFPFCPEQEKNFCSWLEEHFHSIEAFKKPFERDWKSFSCILPNDLMSSTLGKKLTQLYCRDVVSDYIELLFAPFQEQLRGFVILDASKIDDPLQLAYLSSKKHFSTAQLIVRPALFPVHNSEKARVGICLPPIGNFLLQNNPLREIFAILLEKKIPYRIIPEECLLLESEGLDHLIVSFEHLSKEGHRLVKGFLAAEGTAVAADKKFSEYDAISFDAWIEKNQALGHA